MNCDSEEGELLDYPTCPSCGFEEVGYWEYDFGPGLEGEAEFDCPSCGEPIEVIREVQTYFRTYKGSRPKSGKKTDDTNPVIQP